MSEIISNRKIIHIDMDAFFASVEQMDNPELRGKAVAVGGSEIRGVVAAASYEARKFGVRSAMSGALAKKNCPHIIFVTPRFDRYREISNKIHAIFKEYTDLVEPLSLDEAYLDVTQNKKGNPSASLLAQEIRQRIFEKVGLTASAGISVNKFVAKIASDYNKPNGQKTIATEEVIAFLEVLPISKFYGVGKVTTEKMFQLGIFTGLDLKNKSLEFLQRNFGKSGKFYYDVVRGIHNSEVKSSRLVKSVAAEHTFEANISSEIFLMEQLEKISSSLELRMKRNQLSGKTITLKIKYSDFSQQTRSKTISHFISSRELILENVKELLYQERIKDSVRLLGISISNLNNSEEKNSIAVQLRFDF